MNFADVLQTTPAAPARSVPSQTASDESPTAKTGGFCEILETQVCADADEPQAPSDGVAPDLGQGKTAKAAIEAPLEPGIDASNQDLTENDLSQAAYMASMLQMFWNPQPPPSDPEPDALTGGGAIASSETAVAVEGLPEGSLTGQAVRQLSGTTAETKVAQTDTNLDQPVSDGAGQPVIDDAAHPGTTTSVASSQTDKAAAAPDLVDRKVGTVTEAPVAAAASLRTEDLPETPQAPIDPQTASVSAAAPAGPASVHGTLQTSAPVDVIASGKSATLSTTDGEPVRPSEPATMTEPAVTTQPVQGPAADALLQSLESERKASRDDMHPRIEEKQDRKASELEGGDTSVAHDTAPPVADLTADTKPAASTRNASPEPFNTLPLESASQSPDAPVDSTTSNSGTDPAPAQTPVAGVPSPDPSRTAQEPAMTPKVSLSEDGSVYAPRQGALLTTRQFELREFSRGAFTNISRQKPLAAGALFRESGTQESSASSAAGAASEVVFDHLTRTLDTRILPEAGTHRTQPSGLGEARAAARHLLEIALQQAGANEANPSAVSESTPVAVASRTSRQQEAAAVENALTSFVSELLEGERQSGSPSMFASGASRLTTGTSSGGNGSLGSSREQASSFQAPFFPMAGLPSATDFLSAVTRSAADVVESSPDPTPRFVDREVAEPVRGVHLRWNEGVGEARLRLGASQFGDVSISVRVDNHVVTATLRTGSAEQQARLAAHEAELRAALNQQGLELNHLVVAIDPDREQRQQPREEQPAPRTPRRQSSDARFEIKV